MNVLFKKALLIVCVGFASIPALASQLQLRGSGIYYAPNGAAATGSNESGLKDVEWDKGAGFEVQGILWQDNSLWGCGASIGVGSWDVDDYFNLYSGSSGTLFADSFSGDADLTIIGLSLFRTLFSESEKLNVALEGGIRYVTVDSNVKGFYGAGDESGPQIAWAQALEFDDAILGLFAISLDYVLSETVSIFAQGGIQFDIDNGTVENKVPGLGTGTYSAGDMELQAGFAQLGLSIDL